MNEFPSPRVRTTAATGMVTGGLLAAAVLFFCDPARVPIYPVCLFHRFTGLNCPGCGSLRALHALLHGQWLAAMHCNLFLVLSLPLFAWFACRLVRSQTRGEPAPAVRPVWLWLYAAAWIAFGILRNLPSPAFASLAP